MTAEEAGKAMEGVLVGVATIAEVASGLPVRAILATGDPEAAQRLARLWLSAADGATRATLVLTALTLFGALLGEGLMSCTHREGRE
jgi:hypothetical protein